MTTPYEASSRPKQRTAPSSAAKWRDPRISLLLFASALFVALVLSRPANAQGCTQCRDNAAATSPRTQAAYRRAIILLVVTAGTLFTATVIVLKRSR